MSQFLSASIKRMGRAQFATFLSNFCIKKVSPDFRLRLTLTSQNLLGIGDNVIATTRGTNDAEKYYLYNKDVRESTSNVLDDAGKSQVSYEYDDFGKTENM